MVQNADITLENVVVPERLRLQGANSFKDTAKVLRLTRAEVAWAAVGVAVGAYEAALRYAQERVQFGKPLAAHQLIQDLLVKSLGNITASIGVCTRVSEMLDQRRAARRALRTRQGVRDLPDARDGRLVPRDPRAATESCSTTT